MPYCMKCLKELSETELVCPACGEETHYSKKIKNKTVRPEDNPDIYTEKNKMPKVAYTLGLISFIISFIPFVCLFSSTIGPAGIVVSAIAKARFKYSEKAKKGLILSILSVIIGIIIYFVSIIVLALLMS